MIKIGKLNISKKNLIIISVVIFIVIGGIFLLTRDNGKGLFYNPDKNIKIVKSEASKIELEDYKTNEFSIKIPKGWKVDTLVDYIHYTIKEVLRDWKTVFEVRSKLVPITGTIFMFVLVCFIALNYFEQARMIFDEMIIGFAIGSISFLLGIVIKNKYQKNSRFEANK